MAIQGLGVLIAAIVAAVASGATAIGTNVAENKAQEEANKINLGFSENKLAQQGALSQASLALGKKDLAFKKSEAAKNRREREADRFEGKKQSAWNNTVSLLDRIPGMGKQVLGYWGGT